MNDEFAKAAPKHSIDTYRDELTALESEVSNILGFDISRLKDEKSRNKGFEFEYKTSSLNEYAAGIPIYIGVYAQTRGLRSLFNHFDPPGVYCFKRGDQLRITTSSFSDKSSAVATHGAVRGAFMQRIDVAGICLETILPQKKTVPEP